MNASFLKREWGAVSFVLTVVLGLLAVPIALYFGNQSSAAGGASPPPAASAPRTTAPSAGATSSSPSPSTSPTP